MPKSNKYHSMLHTLGQIIKKYGLRYLPDALILLGVFFIAKSSFYECHLAVSSIGSFEMCSGEDYVAGIMLLVLGGDILLRRLILKIYGN